MNYNCSTKENKERIGANRAALSIARKLIRRAHHTLRELGEEAISEPINAPEPNRSDES
jgi:hypothetical protein